jgi:hypothetical protein
MAKRTKEELQAEFDRLSNLLETKKRKVGWQRYQKWVSMWKKTKKALNKVLAEERQAAGEAKISGLTVEEGDVMGPISGFTGRPVSQQSGITDLLRSGGPLGAFPSPDAGDTPILRVLRGR